MYNMSRRGKHNPHANTRYVVFTIINKDNPKTIYLGIRKCLYHHNIKPSIIRKWRKYMLSKKGEYYSELYGMFNNSILNFDKHQYKIIKIYNKDDEYSRAYVFMYHTEQLLNEGYENIIYDD
jgi:hypothetical protein